MAEEMAPGSRAALQLMASCDQVLHHLTACRLQRPHATPGQEPHALILVAAVHDVDTVAHDRVMVRGARFSATLASHSFVHDLASGRGKALRPSSLLFPPRHSSLSAYS